MKKINRVCFFLALALFVVSCSPTTGTPSQATEILPTVAAVFPTATVATPEPTPGPTPIPSIPVMSLPDKHSDATQWKEKFEGMIGEFSLYDDRDVSPDGRWFLSISLGDLGFLLRFTPLDSSSQPIEYQIEPGDIFYVRNYSWSPDSSAVMLCVNYVHSPNGCEAIKIIEILPEGVLKEHDIAWGGGEFQVLWYGGPIFVSAYSGIYSFNRQGSLYNHTHIKYITDAVIVPAEYPRSMILAVQRHFSFTGDDDLPSKLYALDTEMLEPSEIYASEFPLNLLGNDQDAKCFLFEEMSPDRQQSVGLALFELETRSIVQRYVFPPGTRIEQQSSGPDQVAFSVRAKGSEEREIWLYDFQTKSIEIRGSGTLMGWLHPSEGFLVRDAEMNWMLLRPE